jgi:hypothetical protein
VIIIMEVHLTICKASVLLSEVGIFLVFYLMLLLVGTTI